MPEYIKREEVIAKNHGGVVYIDDIKEIPTTDVAPVVHGKWISYLDGEHLMPERYYECSKCGDRGYKFRGNYCSSCGAKMDLT